MQFRELRRILQHVVIAGLPASAGACVDTIVPGSDCVETLDRTILIDTPTEAPLQLRIDSCRVDVDACRELCVMAMQRSGIEAGPTACSVEFRGDVVEVAVSYEVYHDGPNCPVEGRRPDGLARPRRVDATTAAGAWLAHAAWLEAASVHAFVRLARELGDHGAPQVLIRGAVFAARDEVRHTAIMTRLAARHGAVPPQPEVAAVRSRPLEALAIENAVEGCVRETWAVVLALWQSCTARDPEVRAALRVVARDETRHAALAWAVDRWACARLDPAAVARVAAARAAAAHELVAAADGLPARVPMPALGIPDGLDLRGLVARTHAALWQGGRSCHA